MSPISTPTGIVKDQRPLPMPRLPTVEPECPQRTRTISDTTASVPRVLASRTRRCPVHSELGRKARAPNDGLSTEKEGWRGRVYEGGTVNGKARGGRKRIEEGRKRRRTLAGRVRRDATAYDKRSMTQSRPKYPDYDLKQWDPRTKYDMYRDPLSRISMTVGSIARIETHNSQHPKNKRRIQCLSISEHTALLILEAPGLSFVADSAMIASKVFATKVNWKVVN
ncbi:hypothetical protein K474DRAFT_1702549 [Panus rudis PR-1116 ss-1]|nr:hypothetical protein K474DRAFT_1702549 [Panus rudis PR-1116 ss-1]